MAEENNNFMDKKLDPRYRYHKKKCGHENSSGDTPGKDGITPHIGENGNWFIGQTDTGTKALGTDGKDGANGTDGEDGTTPHIGENGNWFIGQTDTGTKALGTDGRHGTTPHIGENGNWFIGQTDTGMKALGTDGKDGIGDTPDNNAKYVRKYNEWVNLYPVISQPEPGSYLLTPVPGTSYNYGVIGGITFESIPASFEPIVIHFTTHPSGTSFDFPSDVTIKGTVDNPNTRYELSIVNKIAVFI